MNGDDDIGAAIDAPHDAPDFRAPDGEPGAEYDVKGPPKDCPIEPLGFLKQRTYFLDHAKQLIELGTEMRKGEVMALFGTRQHWLNAKWPTKKQVTDKKTGEIEWVITGFDQKESQRDLIVWCARKGLFDPQGKVRGRGAHRGPDGELILHCGSTILIGGKRGTRNNVLKSQFFQPGLIGGYVYPAHPELARPDDNPAPIHVGEQVLALLNTWRWRNGDTDGWLLLCWIAAATLGGAIRHRPHVWITGPSGAGKTTLQQFLREVMGDWGVFTEDATEAGVRQLLDQDTLAVMFDEIEPDEANGEAHMKIVKLARLAYSGGGAMRGSQDHKAKQFVARSCFLFSSIHHHELPAQDRNRMAILNLREFPPKTKSLMLPSTLKAWGNQLRRRMIEQWHRYDATLAAYQAAMLTQGYNGREQDTYGTLLACGDLLLHDQAPAHPNEMSPDPVTDEDLRCITRVRDLSTILHRARAEAEDTTERCLKWLTSATLTAKPGEHQMNVGRWVTRALIDLRNGTDSGAKAKLRTHGLRIVGLAPDHEKDNGAGGILDRPPSVERAFLSVANKSNQAMLSLFDKSTWRSGTWNQALALVPGAVGRKKVRYDGPGEWSVVVPIGVVIDVPAAIEEAEQLILPGVTG